MIRRSSLIITIIITLLAVLLLSTLPVAADNPPQGTIQGKVTNGTTNVVPSQSLNATLKAYLNGEISDTKTTQTGANGAFSFTGLDTSANYTYQVQVSYNKATFLGDQITFPSGQDTVSTNVSVYDTTTDLSVLSVSMAHLVVYTASGQLTVTEVYYVNNSSSKAYNGQLTFDLPDNAMPTDMASDLSWTSVDNNNALVDSDALPPGQTQIDYTYTLPQADSYSLTRTVPLALQQMSVLVQGGMFNVSSPQLTKDTPLSMSGTSFDDYTSAPLQAGSELNIVLSKAGAASSSNQLGIWLAVIAAILLIGAGVYFVRLRSNRAAPAYAGPDGNATSRWDELLDELASLDDQRDAGTISEEEYRAARDQAKAELKDIMSREDDGGGD